MVMSLLEWSRVNSKYYDMDVGYERNDMSGTAAPMMDGEAKHTAI